jgi:hypothetical protein
METLGMAKTCGRAKSEKSITKFNPREELEEGDFKA